MNPDALFFQQLEELLGDFPPDSILSRTIYQDDSIKSILFGFHPGQELSEHTASVPAVLHFIQGEAQLVLGSERKEARGGTWARIPPHLPHSISAKTKTLMLLYLLPDQESQE